LAKLALAAYADWLCVLLALLLYPPSLHLFNNNAGIVMGKHSGRNALNTRLQQLGFDLTPQEVDDVFRRFKVGAAGDTNTRPRLHHSLSLRE
jgi:isopropylmalate/homocitrate/citramalate synthase